MQNRNINCYIKETVQVCINQCQALSGFVQLGKPGQQTDRYEERKYFLLLSERWKLLTLSFQQFFELFIVQLAISIFIKLCKNCRNLKAKSEKMNCLSQYKADIYNETHLLFGKILRYLCEFLLRDETIMVLVQCLHTEKNDK